MIDLMQMEFNGHKLNKMKLWQLALSNNLVQMLFGSS